MSNLLKDAPIQLNPDLEYLGTETAFGFGAEVLAVDASKKFPQIYKFHVGDTGPKTPQPIIDTAVKALQDKQTKYGHFQGYPSVRRNIAAHWNKTRGINIDEDNIILTPGGKSVIDIAMQAFSGPENFIVGQNPGYPIYESLARFRNHNRYLPWYARAENGLLRFDVSDLEKIVQENSQVRLVVLNTPQNPTGMMMSQANLERVAALAHQYNFYVLFDDIYDQITFGGREHYSIISAPGMVERTINLNGYSKDFAMTGWRLGFAVAPKWLVKIFGQLAINQWSCVNTVGQICAGVVFGDVEVNGIKYPSVAQAIRPMIAADVAEYERKGKFVFEVLSLLKPFVIPNSPEGAFYIFPNIQKILDLDFVKNDLGVKSEKEFTRWMLYERGFACLAGPDFGAGAKGHIRFSYAEDRNLHVIPGMKYFVKMILEILEKSGQILPFALTEVNARVVDIEKACF
ncbi:MAG: pyridoxal phosphate-dependent aminotransferase [Candidatus Magasanikbacteria bacterium]|jgi:aspartate/methionine/tyrosine aminotransferase